MTKVFVYDPTASDKLSAVRGVGRYLRILKENFPDWTFTNHLPTPNYQLPTPNYQLLTTNYQLLTPIFINPFFNFLQPPLTLKRLAKKQIAIIHDLIPLKYEKHFPFGIKGKINIFLNKLALKNYDLIITDSQASKNDIIKILKIDEKKVKLIYPCLPKIFGNSKLLISNLRKNKNPHYQLPITNYCLYVGDATWNKNLVNLAKAIKIANITCVFVGKIFEEIKKLSNEVIKEENKNSNYSITKLLNYFSHPWQQEIKEFIRLTKDDKRFIFAGFLPDLELIKLYQQATLNVLISRDEGFGFSYLEASQFSTPSVLSDIPVLKEISAGNALFANPENPNDLADKIGEIYFNKDLRDKLGKKAKKRSRNFSSEKFKKDFLLILKSQIS